MAKIKLINKQLVIVESPSKAKTIQKYLGRDFVVKASVGHIKDLPKSKLGVDPSRSFATDYQVLPTKLKIMEELKKAAKGVTHLYLATDPDREGEAIAWHIKEELGGKGLKKKKIYRVLFNAITKQSVEEAIAHPVELSTLKYQAQQARRILDRLVGYKISPLLWDKVKRGISAGRVQSVSLRIMVDREREIQVFKPKEFWTIDSCFGDEKKNPKQEQKGLQCKLFKIDKKDPELTSEQEVKDFLKHIEQTQWFVSQIEKKERQRKPQPPFITSKLQQDAATKLGFSAKKTMMLAQKLYEGVFLGEYGTHGLITYMRTDSVRTEPTALEEVRQYILSCFGKLYLPFAPIIYQTKKSAQDAHEAIRPASLDFPPEKIKGFLEDDMMVLYQLIWNRFVASQMNPAVLDQVSLEIQGQDALKRDITFRVSFSTVKFPGFTRVYVDAFGEMSTKSLSIATMPQWKEKQQVWSYTVDPVQHFTMPPARFNDASLIKDLEERGIGRPSTYATILSNLQDREYVEKRENKFFPTELGIVVSDLLVQSFPEILNPEFTANMENQLDEIEEGTRDWIQSLSQFWSSFEKTLLVAQKQMKNLKQQVVETKIACELCAKPMVIKWGKMGSFLACSGYPDCKNTQDFKKNEQGEIEVVPKEYSHKKCVKCNHAMLVKQGKYGKFLACSDYPTCKATQPYGIGIACPKCATGEIAQRQSIRFKRVFYSCDQYPQCVFALWDLPVAHPCPACGFALMIDKVTKRQGHIRKCAQKECKFMEFLDAPLEATVAAVHSGARSGKKK